MNNIIPFNFQSKEVRALCNEQGEPLFIAKDVAIALGYKRPNDAVNLHCNGAVIYRPILDKMGRTQEARVIREPDMYRLIIKSDLPSAVEFERVVFEDILPAIRRTGETSKLRMLSKLGKEQGVSTKFLPDYSDETLTKALGDLLNEHGANLSARAVNPILIAMGLLEERERRSTSGNKKLFKSLTADGLKYGKNETSKQSPNQTQPRYYVDQFPQLLDKINKWMASDTNDPT